MKTFAVSKVELDADGRVVAVLWCRVGWAERAQTDRSLFSGP
jgi:hypothetical protein